LEEKKVGLYIVGSETLGYEEFLNLNLVPKSNVFIDQETVLAKAFATPLNMSDVLSGVFSFSMWSRMYNSRVSGNMVVSKNQYYMDTMLVFSGENGELKHQEVLKSLADSFDINALMKAVDNVDNVVVEPTSEPLVID